MLEQTIERWFDEATMKGVRQGKQEGMQLGMQQGEQKGFAKLVALQLGMRFGPMPVCAQELLNEASAEQLTKWASTILTAQSLDDLFGKEGPVH